MPTEAALERLQALVNGLTPLGQVQRGTLIRAEDWNKLVAGVLDVARAVLGVDRPEEVPPHDHADQVTLAWLDARLRSLVERGPLSLPDQAGRLGAAERDLSRSQARLDELDVRLVDLRGRLAGLASDHAVREVEIVDLHKQVTAAGDSRDAVEDLRASVQSVRVDVQTAIDLGKRLTIDGQPADLEDVNRRLASVEDLRKQMTLPSGQILDAASVERRLAALDGRFATKAELALVEARPVTVPASELAAIEGRLRTGLAADLERSNRDLTAAITGSTAEALAGVDARITRVVAEATPSLSESILAGARAETAEAVRTGIAAADAGAAARLAAADAALRAAIDAGLAGVLDGVATRVRAELDKSLPSRLAELSAAVAVVTSRADAALGRLDAVDARTAGVEARLLELTKADADGRAELSRALTAEMDRRDAAQADAFAKLVAGARAELGATLTAAVADARRSILEEARNTATQAALTEVKLTSAQLRSELRTIARDEIRLAGGGGARPSRRGGG